MCFFSLFSFIFISCSICIFTCFFITKNKYTVEQKRSLKEEKKEFTNPARGKYKYQISGRLRSVSVGLSIVVAWIKSSLQIFGREYWRKIKTITIRTGVRSRVQEPKKKTKKKVKQRTKTNKTLSQ
jgi:hypothetical protein